LTQNAERQFLFLQGPHGPFFRDLAKVLGKRGAGVHRVAFNTADEVEWRGAGPLYRFNDSPERFESWLRQRIQAHDFTDIILYGDTRPVHRTAIELARELGLTTHCLEEGYVRPNWVTYERRGNNGNSPLMSLSVPRMAKALERINTKDQSNSPDGGAQATWGAANRHLWYSAIYHARCLLPTRRYCEFRGHRDMPLLHECAQYWLRAVKMPWIWARRSVQQWLLLRSSRIYHLALLQLSFDASMKDHSDYESTAEFIEEVIDAFAAGAGNDEYLVVKAHPFEDGRENHARTIRQIAQDLGVGKRVLFVDGGKKLAALLDRARSAVTVNSTAAQQALWRGLPVAALGRAIYKKPGLVSEQTLTGFFAHPCRPDLRSYWVFRRFLMETSQFAGSFYGTQGIKVLLETLPDTMLGDVDPYERLLDDMPEVPDAVSNAVTRLSVAS
jgi:capsular polysaccharide export protein